MKLYERFGEKGFHSSYITSFGIDFDAYENVCLTRLRGAGCTNNFILPDRAMLTHALDGASVLPRHAGRLYLASGINAPRGGVFHSKIFLRFGRRIGELLVGSANMTSPGLAGNREIVGAIECGIDASGEQSLVAAAWQYLEPRLDMSQAAIEQQTIWMLARTPWLKDAEPAAGLALLRDGTHAAFLTNDRGQGIGRQFTSFIEERPVLRLIVVSPYWDEGLSALSSLITDLAPQETLLLIEPRRQLFPTAALPGLPDVRLSDLNALDKTRFFHAKAIIAQTATADHVLFGSANCTTPALGTKDAAGSNEEACLYRRLPPQAAIASLAIEKLLAGDHAIDRSALKPQLKDQDLNLPAVWQRNPGRFECLYDTLTWWPPERVSENAVIELLDAEGMQLPLLLSPLNSQTSSRSFRLSEAKVRPALARLLYPDGARSAPAIVTIVDSVKLSAKEAHTRKVDEAAALLAEETQEGFWVWEQLNILETTEKSGVDDVRTVTRRRLERPDAPPEQHRILDYESFIASRHGRTPSGTTPASSFAGSELSYVHGFLNRMLGINRPAEEPPPEPGEDEDLSDTFDMRDETADAQRAIEHGQEFKTKPSKDKKRQDEAAERERLRRERRKAHAEKILAAMDAFGKRIRERDDTGQLDAVDVLRLRALIVIVAAAGYGGTGSSSNRPLTAMQAFPAAGDANSWPRLLGRIVAVFFGGTNPAIRKLHLDASFERLTADIKETWATCYWTVQACLEAARKYPHNQNLIRSLEAIATRLYSITRLHAAELESDEILEIVRAMNERYADRLGVDAGAIDKGHRAYAQRVNG